MNAKILLLPGSTAGDINCACAEHLLSSIAASFGHRLSLLRGRLGKSGTDEVLPEETVQKCADCQAVFVGHAQSDSINELYDALNLPLVIRSFCLPNAVTGAEALRFYIAQALSLDVDTLPKAVDEAVAFAADNDLTLTSVAPNGHTRKLWDNCLSYRAERTALLQQRVMTAPEAARAILRFPHSLGLLFCPAYAGSILSAEAETVFPCPEFLYDIAPGRQTVYAPVSASAQPNIRACAAAVSAMLRHSLSLPGEAACLDAAMESVLAQDNSRSAEEMLDKICEEMTVAGELTGLRHTDN